MEASCLFSLFLVAFSLICSTHQASSEAGDGFSSSSQKLVKIKKHEKSRNVKIMEKTQTSGDEPLSDTNQYQETDPTEELGEDIDYNPEDVVYVSEVTESYSYEEISCVKPHPGPLTEHADFATELLSSRVFFPMGSTFFYNRISQLLTGKYFHQNNPATACIRGIVEYSGRRYHGFGKKKMLPCTGSVLDSTCTWPDGKKLRVTAIWSDGESMVLLVACNNGKGRWVIASNQQFIDHDVRKTVMKKITELGFDKTDVYELQYSLCDPAVPNSFMEGDCEDEIKGLGRKETLEALKVLQKGVFTPFSSASYVYALGMFIRGSPLKNEEEINSVCARHHWTYQGVVTTRGFGNQKSILQCNFRDLASIICVPLDTYGDNDRIYVYNKLIRPIWTDGENYVLSYNCLSMNTKTWVLYSTEKTVNKETKEYVLSKIADYGFDPKKARKNKYDQCDLNQ